AAAAASEPRGDGSAAPRGRGGGGEAAAAPCGDGGGLQEPPVVRLLGPECRTLTVGDGDLAFSAALADSWGHARARGLVATVYDLDTEVAKKYAAAPGRISRLREAGAE
ncbi:unnamed protein product, partial [Prorocentrum cordatum]